MQMALRFAAAMVFVAVAGCANENTTPRDSVVVSVSAYGPDNFGLHKHGVGASYDVRDTDSRTPLAFPPMDLRACNASNTACALGYGVIDGFAEVVSTNATDATVTINLKYQVGRSYSFDANGQRFKQEVPSDVQALQANQVISKHYELAYGEVVRLPLQYGVEVALCAMKKTAGELTPDRRVCQER